MELEVLVGYIKLQRGYTVIVNFGSNDEAAKNFQMRLVLKRLNVMLATMNLAKMISDIYEKHKNIDILINNAGITRDAPLHKMSKENWQKVIDVNLNSVFNVTSLVINKMRENRPEELYTYLQLMDKKVGLVKLTTQPLNQL